MAAAVVVDDVRHVGELHLDVLLDERRERIIKPATEHEAQRYNYLLKRLVRVEFADHGNDSTRTQLIFGIDFEPTAAEVFNTII